MSWFNGRDRTHEGWFKAPRDVELEIQAVWQEDDMPPELKSDPSYVPFTLSANAQTWVDSMQDGQIVDGGNGVYGRPRSLESIHHRSLSSSPPRDDPAVHDESLPAARPTGSRSRVVTTEIVRGAPPPVSPPGAAWRRVPIMPDVAELVVDKPAPALMPDIVTSSPPSRSLPARTLIPEIGAGRVAQDSNPPPPSGPSGAAKRSPKSHVPSNQLMPEIEDAVENKRKQKDNPLMPDI